MAADALEGDQRAARVAVALPAAGLERDLARDGDAVQRELPADQPGQRLHRGRVERDVGERPEAGDAGRDAVPALGLRADHGGLDAARAAFEDRRRSGRRGSCSRCRSSRWNRGDSGRCPARSRRILGLVVDRGDGVVDERGLHGAVAGGGARRDLIGAPAGARDDRRSALGLGGARPRQRPRRRLHEPGLQAARVSAHAQLELVGGAGVDGIGAADRAVAGGQRGPAGPAPAAGAGPQLGLEVRGAGPAQPGEVEPARSFEHRGRAPPAAALLAWAWVSASASSNTAAPWSAPKAGEPGRSVASAAAPAPRRIAWRRVRR